LFGRRSGLGAVATTRTTATAAERVLGLGAVDAVCGVGAGALRVALTIG